MRFAIPLSYSVGGKQRGLLDFYVCFANQFAPARVFALHKRGELIRITVYRFDSQVP